MHTMGLSRLCLVAPKRFPDPEADARAKGAVGLLERATVVPSLDAAIADCALAVGFSARPRELGANAVTVRAAAIEAVATARESEVALVFGNEMSGLSNNELARCSTFATIPATPGYSSLNLAAAVINSCRKAAGEAALPLLDLVRAGAIEYTEFPPQLVGKYQSFTQADLTALFEHAHRTLAALRFFNPERPRRLLPRLRRLFARAGLEREEVNILRGILAAIDRALARADKH